MEGGNNLIDVTKYVVSSSDGLTSVHVGGITAPLDRRVGRVLAQICATTRQEPEDENPEGLFLFKRN
jgi:hypothetical protein